MLCYVMRYTFPSDSRFNRHVESQVDPCVTTKGMNTFALGYEYKFVFRTIIFFC